MPEADPDPAAYGDAFADVYDAWYAEISDVDATVEAVVALVNAAGGGPVLELGIGTGRLALPLVARGIEVFGIDASAAMVERLRAKPGGAAIRVAMANFADPLPAPLAAPGGFAVVLIAFNTFCNLASADEQARCLANAAPILAPNGSLVVEMSTFADSVDGPDEASSVDPARGIVHRTRRDRGGQTIVGAIEGAGAVRRYRVRYLSPDELDSLAADAGLALVSRWSGWSGEPFDDDADQHVSVYRRVTG